MKYPINHLDDRLLSSRLRKIFKHDKYANSHGYYRVNSLYFDNINDHALREKIDGVNVREKFRIRYYNQDTSYIKLEKKSKRDSVGYKSSARLTSDEVLKIINNDYEFLLTSNEPLLVEFYTKIRNHGLRAKSIVVYDREAFTYAPGNCRVTFDRNLRTTDSIQNFLNNDFKQYNISDSITVLEVKYDNFLPDIVKMAVQIKDRHVSAYSKYAVSRSFD